MLDSTKPTSPPKVRARQRILQLTRWLIPPIFACAAALLHYEFHVPRSQMVPRAKDDKKKTKPRAPKQAKDRKPWQPREQAELDKLRVRWEKEAIVDEPDDPDFRRQHDTLLRAVVQIARETALDQPPISLRVTPRCKTIRCKLDLCGPGNAVDAIAEVLPKVERHDGPLWHELREVEPDVEAPPSPTASPKPDAPEKDEVPEAERRSCRAWVVGFRVDGTKRKELKIAGQEEKPEPAVEKRITEPRDSSVPTDAPLRPGPEPK